MAIPRKVQEQAERAEGLQRKLAGNTAEPQGEPAPAPVAQSQPEQPVATVVSPSQPTNPQPKEAAPRMPEPTPAQVQPQQPTENWEHKYKVLAGKFSAEVPKLHEQLRTQEQTISQLQADIEALKSAPKEEPFVGKLTPEEVVERFGEDFASAVGAVADRVVASRAESLRKEFAPQIKQATDMASQSSRQEFLRTLDALVPNWKQIDLDEGFTAYLDTVDPMSGRPRRHFFNEADSRNDAQRVARFFSAYAGASTAAASSSSASIEQQLSPDSSRVSAVIPPGKRRWRATEIKAFYDGVRRNMYSAAERQRIESDIFAAQREGRIAA